MLYFVTSKEQKKFQGFMFCRFNLEKSSLTNFLKFLLNCVSSLFGDRHIYATATASHRCAEWSDEDINHTHPQ